MTNEELRKLILQIKNATKEAENTAERVGSAILAIFECVNIDELSKFFLRKDIDDVACGLITFLQGWKTKQWIQGTSGSGLYQDADGNWHFESDYVNIRRKLTAEEIEVQKTSHIGGKLMQTSAAMICSKVEEFEDFYRCYMLLEDSDGNKIYNQFKVDDQAIVETFNLSKQADGKMGNHFLWRLVLAIGEDYIDLSKPICALESDVPIVGDNIVQLGYRGTDDPSRKNATIMAGAGEGSPYYKQFTGIDSFTLPEEETRLKPGNNKLKGQIIIESGSTGYDNFTDKPDIESIKGSVDDLNDYIDGTFAKGIIEKSEAKAIEKYINSVNNTKATVEATYNKLYANIYLEGTPKTALLNTKISLFGSISALISAINSAIADSKITATEKNNVDSKFSIFNSAIANFYVAVEDANKAIQDKLKSYSDDVQRSVENVSVSLNNIPKSVKDSIALTLGYTNFATLEAAAQKGNTIISGGKINTELIEATAIITAQVIADAIRTNTLNVNNKFIVGKDGTFKAVGGEMKDMLLTGAFRTPFTNGRFRWDSEGGPIYAETDGLQNNNNVIIPNSNTDYSILHCNLPASMDYDGFNATIINDNFEGVRTHGSISLNVPPGYAIYDDGVKKDSITVPVRAGVDMQGFSDGTAFRGWIVKNRFKSSESEEPEYGAVVGLASPEAGGQVIGDGDKIIGTTGTLTAIANKGYEFSHWNDDLTTPSREVTWTATMQTFRAYFIIPEIYYTITVLASPASGGNVTGGGRKMSDATGFIKAVPNNGYAFNKWNDGNTETDRLVTWDADKTYTAYFIVHVPTGELLTNSDLSSSVTGFAPLMVDMVGDNNMIVFNKILLWGVNNYVSGTTRAITFNKGYLSGKVVAGKKFRFKVDVAAVSQNVGKHLMVLIGTVAEPMVGNLDETFNALGIGDTVIAHELTEGYVTLIVEFTSTRTSLLSDCITFISDSIDGIIYIKNMSLKEV